MFGFEPMLCKFFEMNEKTLFSIASGIVFQNLMPQSLLILILNFSLLVEVKVDVPKPYEVIKKIPVEVKVRNLETFEIYGRNFD